MSIRPFSFRSLEPMPLAAREVGAEDADFAVLCPAGSSFADFLSSLPGTGMARDLLAVRDAVLAARDADRGVVLGCGGHVVAMGLGPMLVRAMEQGLVTVLALTGDALLQDVEVAISGHTVLRQGGRDAGVFGVSEEAGQLINHAIHVGARENQGIGEATARALLDAGAEYAQYSLLAGAARLGLPVTVHPAIGMDAFAIHPKSHGESLGATGLRDFQVLAALFGRGDPGVVINVASSMVLPRVMVQAVDVARQLQHSVRDLTVVMMATRSDPQAIREMCSRLTAEGGASFVISGGEELLLPLLFAAVQDAWRPEG